MTDYPYDPELAGSLVMIPPVDFKDVESNRIEGKKITDAWAAYLDRTGVSTREERVPASAPSGAEVGVRIHTPEGGGVDMPVIIDLHGGGFATGSAEVSDARSIQLVQGLGAVVVSVDYRLAPENPYPAALDDAYTVLVWVADQAESLGIDPARLALVGQSAGGGLAAALALLSRDRGGPAIAFQYLGVPEIDDVLATPSMTEYVDTPFWSRPNAILSWQYYLGELHGTEDIPLYAAPARAGVEDLVGLPPAYVSAMQFDPLRDEGIAYAMKLAQAGVPTELHLFPRTFHASFVIGDAAISQRELAEQITVLKAGLGISA